MKAVINTLTTFTFNEKILVAVTDTEGQPMFMLTHIPGILDCTEEDLISCAEDDEFYFVNLNAADADEEWIVPVLTQWGLLRYLYSGEKSEIKKEFRNYLIAKPMREMPVVFDRVVGECAHLRKFTGSLRMKMRDPRTSDGYARFADVVDLSVKRLRDLEADLDADANLTEAA